MEPGSNPFLSDLQAVAAAVESFATVGAIIVGGIWGYMLFVRRRQAYPRANVVHRISHRELGNDKVLLTVDTVVCNIGEIMLALVSEEMKVQQVLPFPAALRTIGSVQDLVAPGRREYDWPLLQSRCLNPEVRKGYKVDIEPGETDQMHYDFLLDSKVEVVKVFSYFRNAKRRDREIGWRLITVYDLRRKDDTNIPLINSLSA